MVLKRTEKVLELASLPACDPCLTLIVGIPTKDRRSRTLMGLIPRSLWAVWGLVTLVHSDLSVNPGVTPPPLPRSSGVG